MKKILIVLLIICFPLALKAESVTYQVDGKDYEGYYLGTGDNDPLLILVHDWDGLTDYEVKRAAMLSALGYNVFAIDLFGKGVRPTETSEKKRLTGELYKDRAQMRKLLDGGYKTGLEKSGQGNDRVVVFGYCFGGAAVLEMARSGSSANGFVSFHGGLQTPEGQGYGTTKGKVVVFHGTADKAVSMQNFADLAVELEETEIEHEMITYSGAPHAFTVFGSDRYRKEADNQSWSRFVTFLDETLKN